ncbi:hypothetical protein Tco_0327197 [Tanacetum coccineum]
MTTASVLQWEHLEFNRTLQENGYLRKGRKTKPKQQNWTRNGKAKLTKVKEMVSSKKSTVKVKADNEEYLVGFTIIDDDDMTKDVVIGMKFCKKYASCQMIMIKFAHGDTCDRIMENE